MDKFKRGAHLCAAGGCKEDAAYTLTLYVGTPGKQAVRLKRASKVVRLCKPCTKAVAHGFIPKQMTARIRDVIETVIGEPCEPPKPKRVK